MINNIQIIFTLVTVKRLYYGNTVECLFYVLVLVICHSLHHRLTFTSLLLAYIQNLIPWAFGLSCMFFSPQNRGVLKIITPLNLVFNGLSTIWKKHEYVSFDILHRMNVLADEVPGYYKLYESVPLLFNCAICI